MPKCVNPPSTSQQQEPSSDNESSKTAMHVSRSKQSFRSKQTKTSLPASGNCFDALIQWIGSITTFVSTCFVLTLNSKKDDEQKIAREPRATRFNNGASIAVAP
jgi:hypothetical protein